MLRLIDEYRCRAAMLEGILDGLLQLIACESPWPWSVPAVGGALALPSVKPNLVLYGRLLYLGEHPLVVLPPIEHAVVWSNRLNADEWNSASINLHFGSHLFDQG